MVAREDDDGILIQLALLEHRQQAADTIIDVAHSAIVSAARTLDLFLVDIGVPQIADLEEALGVRVLLVARDGDGGEDDVDVFV